MSDFEFRLKLIAMFTAAVIVLGSFAMIVVSFTVIPMTRNYQECGTIFLCANQK